MSFIIIPPDSDGAVHDAALHNTKFTTIINELNGNIDHENLKNPFSSVSWNSFGTHYVVTDGGGDTHEQVVGWYATSSIKGQIVTAVAPFVPNKLANGTNVIMNSHRRADLDYVLVGASIIVRRHNAFPAGNFRLELQKGTDVTGAVLYSEMANVSFTPLIGAGLVDVFDVPNLAITLSALNRNEYFRIALQNPNAVITTVPDMWIETYFKTLHVN
jgi:hypothetical protein